MCDHILLLLIRDQVFESLFSSSNFALSEIKSNFSGRNNSNYGQELFCSSSRPGYFHAGFKSTAFSSLGSLALTRTLFVFHLCNLCVSQLKHYESPLTNSRQSHRALGVTRDRVDSIEIFVNNYRASLYRHNLIIFYLFIHFFATLCALVYVQIYQNFCYMLSSIITIYSCLESIRKSNRLIFIN